MNTAAYRKKRIGEEKQAVFKRKKKKTVGMSIMDFGGKREM